MNLIKQNELAFYEKQKEQALAVFYRETDRLKKDVLIDDLSKDIHFSFLSLLDMYLRHKNIGIVDDLKYIHFSFLRSSIITNSLCYRIDFYDDEWLMAENECSIPWQPAFITLGLNNIKQDILEKYKNQMTAPLYQMDKIILEIAEQYNTILDRVLPDAIDKLYQDRELPDEFTCCQIYFGEFLDKCKLIYKTKEA